MDHLYAATRNGTARLCMLRHTALRGHIAACRRTDGRK
jgi:hypothetical protein